MSRGRRTWSTLPSSDGGARHARVPRRHLVLGERDAAVRLDRLESDGPSLPLPDRTTPADLALLDGRERPEQVVDRHVHECSGRSRREPQVAVGQGHLECPAASRRRCPPRPPSLPSLPERGILEIRARISERWLFWSGSRWLTNRRARPGLAGSASEQLGVRLQPAGRCADAGDEERQSHWLIRRRGNCGNFVFGRGHHDFSTSAGRLAALDMDCCAVYRLPSQTYSPLPYSGVRQEWERRLICSSGITPTASQGMKSGFIDISRFANGQTRREYLTNLVRGAKSCRSRSVAPSPVPTVST